MTRDDIIRMAREAGIAGVTVYSEEESSDILSPDIELFAELIAKHILAKSYPELVSLAAKHAAETVAAEERKATLEMIEEFFGMESDRNAMFSDGYDYALHQVTEFVLARGRR
jgi:DNA-binding LacI/PurR family transcriptional regulator